MPEPAKVKANLQRMVADLRIGIEEFSLAAWAEGNGAIVLGIYELNHIFVWKNPAGIFNSLVYGDRSKTLGVALPELIHKAVIKVFVERFGRRFIRL